LALQLQTNLGEGEMPIKAAVDTSPDARLAVLCFSGHVSAADVLAAARGALTQFPPGLPFRELLIFEHDTDLSDISAELLEKLYHDCEALRRDLQLGARSGIAVLDDSMDAKFIMPLFNALVTPGGSDMGFGLVHDVEPAFERLGIPLQEGLKILARAT
jgi:hypothetical protein